VSWALTIAAAVLWELLGNYFALGICVIYQVIDCTEKLLSTNQVSESLVTKLPSGRNSRCASWSVQSALKNSVRC